MEELERMERMFTRFVCCFSDSLFRVRDACFTKCIHRFAEAEISPGEGTCIDRYETLCLFSLDEDVS